MVFTIITQDSNSLSKDKAIFPNEETNKQILVVDDDPDITFFLKTALEANGFFVNAYNDPLKALSEFKIKFYDLLFIDIRMPDLNGFQLFKLIRKKDPKVKICFMTAFESYYNALKEEHPTLNARCFIKKPIEVKNLLSVVTNQLSNTK